MFHHWLSDLAFNRSHVAVLSAASFQLFQERRESVNDDILSYVLLVLLVAHSQFIMAQSTSEFRPGGAFREGALRV